MKPAYDPTSVRITLRQMVAKGYITLEDLDQPPADRAYHERRFRLNHPNIHLDPYRNLLRDDPDPVVSRSDTRDYSPQPGITPAEAPPLPVTLETSPAPLTPPDPDLGIDW